jgi:hypothetical protein
MTLALLTLGVGGPLWAQGPGEIHGKVKDSSGAAVLFGVVRAEQGGVVHGVETDENGRFVLKPLPTGEYTVTVQAAGYHTDTIFGVRVDPGLIVRLPDVVLSSLLATVVVKGYHWEEPLIRVDDPSRMVITASQIKHNATRLDPVDMIAKMTPGVTKAANSDELYFRGSRAGAMAYYVDGVKVTGTNPGVSPDAISRVSVYTGGLPACYGDVTGGVVAIETKSYFDLYHQRTAANR